MPSAKKRKKSRRGKLRDLPHIDEVFGLLTIPAFPVVSVVDERSRKKKRLLDVNMRATTTTSDEEGGGEEKDIEMQRAEEQQLELENQTNDESGAGQLLLQQQNHTLLDLADAVDIAAERDERESQRKQQEASFEYQQQDIGTESDTDLAACNPSHLTNTAGTGDEPAAATQHSFEAAEPGIEAQENTFQGKSAPQQDEQNNTVDEEAIAEDITILSEDPATHESTTMDEESATQSHQQDAPQIITMDEERTPIPLHEETHQNHDINEDTTTQGNTMDEEAAGQHEEDNVTPQKQDDDPATGAQEAMSSSIRKNIRGKDFASMARTRPEDTTGDAAAAPTPCPQTLLSPHLSVIIETDPPSILEAQSDATISKPVAVDQLELHETASKDSAKFDLDLDRFCQLVETSESSQDLALWTESLLAGEFGVLPELTRNPSAMQEDHDLMLGREEADSEDPPVPQIRKQPASVSRRGQGSSQRDWNFSQQPPPFTIQPRSVPITQQHSSVLYPHSNSSGGTGTSLLLLPPAGVQGPRKPLRLPPPGISSLRHSHRHPRSVRKRTKARFQREFNTEYAPSFDTEQRSNKAELPSPPIVEEHAVFTSSGDLVDMQFLDPMDWVDVGNTDLNSSRTVPIFDSLDEDDMHRETTDLLMEDGL